MFIYPGEIPQGPNSLPTYVPLRGIKECGNGVVEEGEECDWGRSLNGAAVECPYGQKSCKVCCCFDDARQKDCERGKENCKQ